MTESSVLDSQDVSSADRESATSEEGRDKPPAARRRRRRNTGNFIHIQRYQKYPKYTCVPIKKSLNTTQALLGTQSRADR
ncbi:hypothetical protein evm_015142 [Chilo suppressalis]|nr:hypothetical protein evm_015142 [Chilo suppressalis]